MGLLAAVCGLFLAILLSAQFGASSGAPAALRTSKTPAPDLAKLRQTTAGSRLVQRQKTHRQVRPVKRSRVPRAPAVPVRAVAQVEAPSTPNRSTQGGQGQTAPVRQLTPPSNPSPSPTPRKPAPRPKPSPGGGTSFDDSG